MRVHLWPAPCAHASPPHMEGWRSLLWWRPLETVRQHHRVLCAWLQVSTSTSTMSYALQPTRLHSPGPPLLQPLPYSAPLPQPQVHAWQAVTASCMLHLNLAQLQTAVWSSQQQHLHALLSFQPASLSHCTQVRPGKAASLAHSLR